MKLRNKKNGEIGLLNYTSSDGNIIIQDINAKDNCGYIARYNSLAELNAEWEDYEEPNKYWYIEVDGDIHHIRTELCDELEIHTMKQIGNYFLSKEEAEKALERLRAWKRLKDKGFRFERWQFVPDRSGIWVKGNLVAGTADELDIIFGGEE